MEKKFYQSKKWISWLISTVVIASILIIALFSQQFTFAMALFMTSGMVGLTANSIGYVLGQSTVDKYLNTISNVVINNNSNSDNDDNSNGAD